MTSIGLGYAVPPRGSTGFPVAGFNNNLKLKRAVITNVKIWQYFAVFIWLVGKQIKA